MKLGTGQVATLEIQPRTRIVEKKMAAYGRIDFLLNNAFDPHAGTERWEVIGWEEGVTSHYALVPKA